MKIIWILIFIFSSIYIECFDWRPYYEKEKKDLDYNFVPISLGYNCSIANRLRDYDFHPTTLPFDWLVTPFSSIYTLIETDFEDFLNPNNCIFFIDHVYDRKFGIKFYHDFPKKDWNWDHDYQEPIEINPLLENEYLNEKFLEVIKKYERRVARLYALLNSEIPIQLMRLRINPEIARQINMPQSVLSKNEIIAFYGLLRNKFLNPNIELICFEINPISVQEEWGEGIKFFTVGKDTPDLNPTGSVSHHDWKDIFLSLASTK